ncbi:hypothetical protein FB107DRAFT_252894, partial [Schizophyllum commune]
MTRRHNCLAKAQGQGMTPVPHGSRTRLTQEERLYAKSPIKRRIVGCIASLAPNLDRPIRRSVEYPPYLLHSDGTDLRVEYKGKWMETDMRAKGEMWETSYKWLILFKTCLCTQSHDQGRERNVSRHHCISPFEEKHRPLETTSAATQLRYLCDWNSLRVRGSGQGTRRRRGRGEVAAAGAGAEADAGSDKARVAPESPAARPDQPDH